MLWEFAESIKNRYVMTVRPALKNLFSSKKSAAGMFCIMLILQLILSVICISGVENMRAQKALLDEQTVSLSQLVDTEEEAAEEGEADGEASSASDMKISSSLLTTALNSTPIFLGFLCLWVLTALIVYQRLASASADRNQYMWGMFITYGARRKKIRAVLKYELYSVLLAASVPAYFLGLLLCNRQIRGRGDSYEITVIPILLILLISLICIRLVVTYEVGLIQSKSCTNLLSEEEGPSKLCHPRRSGKLRFGFSPLRYACSSFFRLRKYYVLLSLSAAIPAIIWLCCQTAAYSQAHYLSSNVHEYDVSISGGITEDVLHNAYAKELLQINGVAAVNATAKYPADEIDSYILSDKSAFSEIDDSILPVSPVYADGDAVIAVCNDAFVGEVGYHIQVPQGGVAVLYPSDAPEYHFSEGDRIAISQSEAGGVIRNVTDTVETLRGDISDKTVYTLLTVSSVTKLRRYSFSSSFLNVQKTYFLLNEADYAKLTGLDPEAYDQPLPQGITPSSVTADGSFTVTLDRSSLPILPAAGDILSAQGSLSYEVAMTDRLGDAYRLEYQTQFSTLYIYDVQVTDTTCSLRVVPRFTVTLKSDFVFPTVLLFGIPPMESAPMQNIYVACDENVDFTVSGATVLMDAQKPVTLHCGSDLRAVEAGCHLKLGKRSFASAPHDGTLLLEELYAANGFDLICADATTSGDAAKHAEELQAGQVILILPEKASHLLTLSVGDRFRLNTTTFDVSQYSANSWQRETATDRLAEAIKKKSTYHMLTVCEIRYDEDAERPQLLLGGEDFAAVTGKDAPYTTMQIELDPDLDPSLYAAIDDIIRQELHKITERNNISISTLQVHSTGEYLKFILRKTADYGVWIRLIGMLIPLTLPFIWYYPLMSLFERRKHDFATLEHVGKRKGQIRRIFLYEGFFVALCAALAIALLAYPAMGIFKLICFFFELPLAFEFAHARLSNLLIACLGGVLCAALAFLACYLVAKPHRRKVKKFKTEKGEMPNVDLGSN